jgi:hypothetical protein
MQDIPKRSPRIIGKDSENDVDRLRTGIVSRLTRASAFWWFQQLLCYLIPSTVTTDLIAAAYMWINPRINMNHCICSSDDFR